MAHHPPPYPASPHLASSDILVWIAVAGVAGIQNILEATSVVVVPQESMMMFVVMSGDDDYCKCLSENIANYYC